MHNTNMNSPHTGGAPQILSQRVRDFLCQMAGQQKPITYQALAKALEIPPPNTIHQLTTALEQLMDEDAAANRPLIAALVISKAGTGLPAIGFFEHARHIGRFNTDPSDPDGAAFYAAEFTQADAYWHNEKTTP